LSAGCQTYGSKLKRAAIRGTAIVMNRATTIITEMGAT
jgi:hypothetical protein